MDREAWHVGVHGVTKIGHDWATELNWLKSHLVDRVPIWGFYSVFHPDGDIQEQLVNITKERSKKRDRTLLNRLILKFIPEIVSKFYTPENIA